jgi:hypothetical protein
VEAPPAPEKEEAKTDAVEEPVDKIETPAEKNNKVEPSAAAATDAPSEPQAKPASGWFASLFGGSPKSEPKEVATDAVPVQTKEMEPAKPEPTVTETKPEPTPMPIQVDTALPTAVESRDDKSSKENYPAASEQLTLPKTFLPSLYSSAKSPTIKRNPSNIVKFKFSSPKSPLAPSSPVAASIKSPVSPPTSPKEKKEWFDPEAKEVDYDTAPTDLFQALEAREFDYAFEMYEQTNDAFTSDCKTWVIAKGLSKGQSLRFRALPLHAAIVFDAPEELIIKILRAYPKASRGRDVKGRLPIHLAMEHASSEQIVMLLIDAFPKGFFAVDKKEMTPLDHVNGNSTRSYMARYLPQLIQAKLEQEREKWTIETNLLLEHQKSTLANDEEFMASLIAHVQEEVEAHNMSKIELLEANYQKEIELLKKKHDSETQALLEGFEVKLNFERKLNKLKVKQ